MLYNVACVSSLGMASFGLFYYYNKNKAEEVMYEVSCGLVKTYHRVSLGIEKFKEWYKSQNNNETKTLLDNTNLGNTNLGNTNLDNINKNIILNTKSETDFEFVGLKLEDHKFKKYCCYIPLASNSNIFETDFDLMFIKKTENKEKYYKRIENKSELKEFNKQEATFKQFEKPFLQIELIQEDIEGGTSRTSIHKFLDNFYFEGNKLLDKIFLQWYLSTFMNIELDDNYTLHIIDADINMCTLKNKCIKLILKDDKECYTIMDNK